MVSDWGKYHKRVHFNFAYFHPDEEDYEDEDYRRKKKSSREEKLEMMDHKLKSIESLIIEDTAKFYDNHDGTFEQLSARDSLTINQ